MNDKRPQTTQNPLTSSFVLGNVIIGNVIFFCSWKWHYRWFTWLKFFAVNTRLSFPEDHRHDFQIHIYCFQSFSSDFCFLIHLYWDSKMCARSACLPVPVCVCSSALSFPDRRTFPDSHNNTTTHSPHSVRTYFLFPSFFSFSSFCIC